VINNVVLWRSGKNHTDSCRARLWRPILSWMLDDSELTYRPVPLSRLFSLALIIARRYSRRRMIFREILTPTNNAGGDDVKRINGRTRNWLEEARAWSFTSRRLYDVAWNAENELEWMKDRAIMPAVFTIGRKWERERTRERRLLPRILGQAFHKLWDNIWKNLDN